MEKGIYKVKVTWHTAKYGNPYPEFVLCILPIQSAHTQQWTHTHREHTHTKQWKLGMGQKNRFYRDFIYQFYIYAFRYIFKPIY